MGRRIIISHPKATISQPSATPNVSGLVPHPVASLKQRQKRLTTVLRRKTVRRRLFRYGIVSVNVLAVAGIVSFVLLSPHASRSAQPAASVSNAPAVTNPLDQLSAASVAVNVAQVSRLAEATAVKNQADTANAELAIVPAGSSVVSKPQVVSASLKSSRDIKTYTTQQGDTVSALAVKYGVTSDSIKWSNSLTSDAVQAGKKLYIPPVNGFVYTVKAGDTPQTLASKYNANAEQIIAFNDAEITGLRVGQIIGIPNGTQPAPVVVTNSSYSLFSGTATYGNNGYDAGYCTWYVADRRIKDGKPIPTNLGNASSWGYLGRSLGLSTGSTPQVGAAVVTNTRGAGHVAYVETVGDDGSMTVSEMNYIGWNKTSGRSFTATEAAGFTYIY